MAAHSTTASRNTRAALLCEAWLRKPCHALKLGPKVMHGTSLSHAEISRALDRLSSQLARSAPPLSARSAPTQRAVPPIWLHDVFAARVYFQSQGAARLRSRAAPPARRSPAAWSSRNARLLQHIGLQHLHKCSSSARRSAPPPAGGSGGGGRQGGWCRCRPCRGSSGSFGAGCAAGSSCPRRCADGDPEGDC